MAIKAIYPGTFDPVTHGHTNIIERASKLFSEVIVGVAANNTKKPMFSLEQRVEMLTQVCAHLPNVTVVGFSGLLVDFAKDYQAQVLVRGIRTTQDFEYEHQLADVNRSLSGDSSESLESVLLTPVPEFSFLSSTIVKEVAIHGGDISKFVAPEVEQAVLAAVKK